MKNILIVDDNEDTKAMLEAGAQISGVNVTVLASGPEAIEYLSSDQHEIDAVLIDLAMYPMDGITLAENIRTMEKVAPFHTEPLKIAFYTAQNVDGVIERAAAEVGARTKAFIKPCTTGELFDGIANWLNE